MNPPSVVGTIKQNSVGELHERYAFLVAGDTYEYCYTFVYAGIESAPSPVMRITLPSDETSAYYALTLESEGVEGDFVRDGTRGRTDYDMKDRGSATVGADSKLRMTGRIKDFIVEK